MIIALVPYEFKNGDLEFNLYQVEKVISQSPFL